MDSAKDERSPGVVSALGEESPLVPEAVFPEQMVSEPAANSVSPGVRGLMLAVLEDAARCLAQRAKDSPEHPVLLALQAERWVRSRDESYVFAFESICSALGLEPEAVRRWLLIEVKDSNSADVAAQIGHRVEYRARGLRAPRPRRRRRNGGAAPVEAKAMEMEIDEPVQAAG